MVCLWELYMMGKYYSSYRKNTSCQYYGQRESDDEAF